MSNPYKSLRPKLGWLERACIADGCGRPFWVPPVWKWADKGRTEPVYCGLRCMTARGPWSYPVSTSSSSARPKVAYR